jgi:hypothetical protein
MASRSTGRPLGGTKEHHCATVAGVSTRAGAVLSGSLGLLRGLVDDAAVFPPRSLPMERAVTEHLAHLASPYSRLVGRFLVPASRLAELQATLASGEHLRVGVVMDTGAAGVAEAVAGVCEDRRLVLSAVEVPLSPEADQAAAAHWALKELARLPDGVSAFVELPRVYGWRDALSLVAARRRGAKLRTGGATAGAFPTELELAIFIHACVEEGVPFKLTAGLHRAVRYVDEATGFEHHGFLNALVATCHAVLGRSVSRLAEVIAVRDQAEVLALLRGASGPTLEAARRHFVGFGCSNVTAPVGDLLSLAVPEAMAAEAAEAAEATEATETGVAMKATETGVATEAGVES